MMRTAQRLTPRRVALGASGARHAIGLNQARRLVGQNRSGGQMNLRTALLSAAVIGCASAAQAACRDDLVATAQDLTRSRTAVESAAQGAAQCAALRQHIATL